jgi:hypothetical protein
LYPDPGPVIENSLGKLLISFFGHLGETAALEISGGIRGAQNLCKKNGPLI